MGPLRFGEGIGLADLDLDRSRGDDVEELSGRALQLFGSRDVGGQGRARDEQGPLFCE